MRYGFIASTGNPNEQVELAVEAERAGWDGFFSWDGMSIGAMDMYDPWAILAAAAVRTERITLGAMVFALTRRRPWKVAREAMTIDHLSGGRLVIPVGLGAADDGGFGKVGPPEATDRRTRAALLDETLAIMEQAWLGERVDFAGEHYRVDGLRFEPRPVQRPRIPIWVVAAWPRPKSMARAARWDGILPSLSEDSTRQLSPDDVTKIIGWLRDRNASTRELIIEGVSPGDDAGWAARHLKPLADAGATWWIESRWEAPNDPATLLERVRQGPPR
ncbi:LLM class flavin-dependent oxidoreductase [Microlunatus parietis]|uniref:Alkanesulfonate monooxygenase SsuD/methylene tetrahydromethanopterin reductase-like flavin-dependent oxidoreductase (Luciferase family) n=1 Tax=Microlunatus parietis TaxID=682979 RepID=A0A7Y9LD22_9ACTN|nr:LLM class flavin-dependent oxidoreductase [Microlunatus parietis]NYE71491.1 alkanesulfonate monooxygenase SsuD/methylene tetrahydromethanopterin reductase-like flavin-dependent oxidoreductase (luciferase family) [Microlunatus parietis]